MIEFKFRAWNDKIKWMSKPFTFGQALNFHDQIIKSLSSDEIVMQFTELTDKNGVFYCQDDIVRVKGKNYRLIKGSYQFELLGFYNSYQDNPQDFFSENMYSLSEIIGNIHENPELL